MALQGEGDEVIIHGRGYCRCCPRTHKILL